jgi:transposase
MARTFKTADGEAALELRVSRREVLPPEHLARFVVDVVSQLDFSQIYARKGASGGQPYAPEVLVARLLYGYGTGVFSSRKIEQATSESIPFRFVAGDLHPDHDTMAHFRRSFLEEIKELFVQVLLLAGEAEVLKLGNISVDGSQIHADASKSQAVSCKRLLELEAELRREVEELLALAEAADQGALPEGFQVADEIARRQARRARLQQAQAVLEARADERYQAERAEYEAKVRERQQKAQATGRPTRGREPKPPEPGPRDKDQYHFTDPESRIMKNSTDDGFDQHDNVPVAVDQDSLLIMATTVSHQANDQQEAVPTIDAIDPRVGTPAAAALENGYFSSTNIEHLEGRRINPYIATGREPHHRSWKEYFQHQGEPPSEQASAKEKMAYKLKTAIGQAIYGLRQCTVEPVIGIIKAVLGFRQFSLRGLAAAAGEWCLVCLAFNVKRLHRLLG